MSYCGACGCKLKDGMRFCPQCGSRVEAAFADIAPVEVSGNAVGGNEGNGEKADQTQMTEFADDGEQPEHASGDAFGNAMRTGRRKGRAKLSPIAIIVLALALATSTAFAAYYVYHEVYLPSVQSQEQSVATEAPQEPAKSSSSSAKKSKSAAELEKEKLEKARREALLAGMQVFDGTVRILTYGEQLDRLGITNQMMLETFEPMMDYQIVILQFDEERDVEGLKAGQWPDTDRSDFVTLPGDASDWVDLDGKKATIAAYAEDVSFATDLGFTVAHGVVQDYKLLYPFDRD